MSQIQRIYVIMVITMILLSISFVKCLPVTSKPIENTPENLAWEAWLMLPPPPTNERQRKITPKSIFILNGSQDGTTHNGNSNLFSNSGSSLPQPQQQIQCPPNHRIDNSKCIPTLSIDRDKIMIQEFAQLFSNPTNGDGGINDGNQSNSPNYNYEFEEYDYGDYNPDESLTDDITFSNLNSNKPDYNNNEQPLKINLSLDKFPLTFDNKESLPVQPFRVEGLSAITDKISPATTTFQTTSSTIGTAGTTINYVDQGKRSTTSDDGKQIGTSTIPTTVSDTAKTRRDDSQQYIVSSTTTIDPIKQINDLEISVDNTNSNLFTATTIGTIDTTTILPTLKPIAEPLNSSGKNIPLSVTNYKRDDGTETLTTTESSNENDDIEIITELPEIEKLLAENLAEESLLYDQLFQDNLTQISLEDETTIDPIETTTNFDDITTTELPVTTTTITPETSNNRHDMEAVEQRIQPVMQSIPSRLHNRNTVKIHEDTEPIMDSIESNNRFVYHHLGSSIPPKLQRHPEKSNPAKDIAEQLRIINMIVEENKRKSQQLKIRFPDDHSRPTEQREGLRADIIRFPEVTTTSTSQSSFAIPAASSFSFPTNQFDPDKYLFHRRYLQTSTVPSSASSSSAGTQKPFWWLPDGWEVNNNGERPLLIRFWSKMPPQSTNDGTTLSEYQFRSNAGTDTTTNSAAPAPIVSTTSGYRENSRSPTENLYREIPAQEVYKVLGAARQWKHSSKR